MTQPIPEQRAYEQEWDAKLENNNLFEPVADPFNANVTRQQQFNAGVGLFFGTVVDSVANMHAYRVFVEQNKPPIVCVAGATTSLLPMGARDSNTIIPGSQVVVMRHPQIRYGIILCVVPPLAISAQLCRSDEITQASHCGLHVDNVHSKTFELSGVLNASAGRPIDSLPIGEAGWFSETGMRIYVDSFMAQLAADEHCGVFAFYHDQLLRTAGHNMQEWSSGHTREVLNDRNEISYVHGIATYPWEQSGSLQPEGEAFRSLAPEKTQQEEAYYAKYEPHTDDQIPFHRLRTFNGYLGQGEKQVLSGLPEGSFYKLSGEEELVGLFESQLTLSGHLGIRSASGITIAKRPNIPVPRQVKLPTDAAADQDDEYRFSGLNGNGQEHVVAAAPQPNPGAAQSPALQSTAAVMDAHAHMFNWEGAHPFHYHQKNWDLPEETDGSTVSTNAETLDFTELRNKMSMAAPTGVDVNVDHRYSSAKVYPNYSFISLLDEGGIVIGDGYGAEIRMVGGNMYLSAPGDVFLQPGRNVQLWGGKDIIMRAKNSVDISASEKDVRIKAEHNMQVLAGNGDFGGILLESKSQGGLNFENQGEDVRSAGILLKCADGPVATWSKNIYMRTGGGDVQGGEITFDANQGLSPILMQANSLIQYVTSSAGIYFSQQGEILGTTYFTPQGTAISGSLSVGGGIIAQGSILNRGGISTVGGNIGAELSVGKMREQDTQRANEVLQEAASNSINVSTDARDSYQSTFTDGYYADNYLGNDAVIEKIHFTFRTSEQYGGENFEMFESRWQQLARLSGQSLGTWEEKAVDDTWPYPGKTAMSDESRFYTQDLTLFDVQTGNSKDRTANLSEYEEPRLAEPTPNKLSTSYTVIQ